MPFDEAQRRLPRVVEFCTRPGKRKRPCIRECVRDVTCQRRPSFRICVGGCGVRLVFLQGQWAKIGVSAHRERVEPVAWKPRLHDERAQVRHQSESEHPAGATRVLAAPGECRRLHPSDPSAKGIQVPYPRLESRAARAGDRSAAHENSNGAPTCAQAASGPSEYVGQVCAWLARLWGWELGGAYNGGESKTSLPRLAGPTAWWSRLPTLFNRESGTAVGDQRIVGSCEFTFDISRARSASERVRPMMGKAVAALVPVPSVCC